MLILFLFLSFDQLVAVVGNSAITEQEVNYLSGLYPAMDREELLDKMIMGRVILSVAEQETVTVSDEEVNSAKQRLLDNIPSLKSLLSSQSYIDSLYNEELRIQLYTRKIIQTKFRERVNVSPVEVSEYYETHKDSFAMPTTVTLKKIDVPILPDEKNRIMKKAERIVQEYEEGRDFSDLAREYSDDRATKFIGGSLGSFKPEDLPPYLSGVLDLGEEEVDIFKSPGGYHIVRMDKRDIGEIKLSHIFLELDYTREELEAAGERAGEIRERWIDNDSSVIEMSSLMGTIPVKSMGPELSTVIDTLDAGSVTEPILEGDSYHLLRVEYKNEGGIADFAEVKANIQNILYQRRIQATLEDWFEKVKENVYIRRL